jgi:hypothetical protein
VKEYVYTKKAEVKAKELGLNERKEGAIAHCGYTPVRLLGLLKTAWLEKGYIREINI